MVHRTTPGYTRALHQRANSLPQFHQLHLHLQNTDDARRHVSSAAANFANVVVRRTPSSTIGISNPPQAGGAAAGGEKNLNEVNNNNNIKQQQDGAGGEAPSTIYYSSYYPLPYSELGPQVKTLIPLTAFDNEPEVSLLALWHVSRHVDTKVNAALFSVLTSCEREINDFSRKETNWSRILSLGPLWLFKTVFSLLKQRHLSLYQGVIDKANSEIFTHLESLRMIRSLAAAHVGTLHHLHGAIEAARGGEEMRRGLAQLMVANLSFYDVIVDEKCRKRPSLDFLKQSSDVPIETLREQLVEMAHCLPPLQQTMIAAVQNHRFPTHFVRNWVRYTALYTISSAAALVTWIYRDELLAKWESISRSFEVFLTEHLRDPLNAIYKEVFEAKLRIIKNEEELIRSRESLQRMIDAFHRDSGKGPTEHGGDMTLVMAMYEDELQHPIVGMTTGHLVRSFLIQVQKLKVDIETQMQAVNELLRKNELNFQLAATIPALLGGGAVSAGITSFFSSRSARRQRRLTNSVRLLLRTVERALTCQLVVLPDDQEATWIYFEDSGYMLCGMQQLHMAACALRLPLQDRQLLLQDIHDLQSTSLSPRQKLFTVDRMFRTFGFLHP